MSFWSRVLNVVRGDRLNREIDEELQTHLAEAVEQGRDVEEARRAFGSALRCREASRDVRLIPWLDSLRADAVFGWRQIRKRKATSAAAILSLALAIGACTSAFRLIDAVLLRPLPIAAPERLYALSRQGLGFYDGKPFLEDRFEWAVFRQMREGVRDRAELLAISYDARWDLTWSTREETEKAFLQYVSGTMFSSFGLKPAMGRLLTESDDLTPGAHPVAVLSYDYWSRRFGRDPKIIGRTFRLVDRQYQVVGIAEPSFTGTEPGTVTDIFVPTMMNDAVLDPGAAWLRTFVLLKPGVSPKPVQERLSEVFQALQLERVKMEFRGGPQRFTDRFLKQTLSMKSAGAGLSGMQKNYRVSLIALAVLVALVLLIACANVANLMTAQAAARAREMALRVSIGAGRWRLVQLILVESAWLAFLAAGLGGAFAWWAAPFVVGMINPPDNPARLYLPADWRVIGFGVSLVVAVLLLFGLAPALRASAIRPASALKGGEDPRRRRRLVPALIALQVAFCFVVEFVGTLFLGTFTRLSNQPTGFSSERLLIAVAAANPPQSPIFWEQAADHLRSTPGVEEAAVAGFALLSGSSWSGFVSIGGRPPDSDVTRFLNVSPGWANAMKIPFLSGRDFRPGESDPGVAIVNSAFAKRHFAGKNAAGKLFEKVEVQVGAGSTRPYQIVGVIGDASYGDMRDPIVPTVYVPFRSRAGNGSLEPSRGGSFIVRTSNANPLSLAPVVRRELARAGFLVSVICTQRELILRQTIRERLLATLALFFAVVALVLAGIGLYGVLNYSVLQRRCEIGIRLSLGAQAAGIVRLVTVELLSMVLMGAIAGLGLGLAAARYVESLLYGVKATDSAVLVLPALAILAVALVAAVPPVVRALRIDPVAMLRSE